MCFVLFIFSSKTLNNKEKKYVIYNKFIFYANIQNSLSY